jgi:hypothetical protein
VIFPLVCCCYFFFFFGLLFVFFGRSEVVCLVVVVFNELQYGTLISLCFERATIYTPRLKDFLFTPVLFRVRFVSLYRICVVCSFSIFLMSSRSLAPFFSANAATSEKLYSACSDLCLHLCWWRLCFNFSARSA